MLQFDSPATWGDALGDSGLPATREQLLLQLCQAFGNVNSDAFHVVFHERSWISIIIATIAIITRFFSRVIVTRLLYSLYYLYLARILTCWISESVRQASRSPQNTPKNQNMRTEYLNNYTIDFAQN
jgi:hypothetical protein